MADSIQIDGKELFSSKRASEISGYAQDYIGQLARAGHIHAQRVGGLWYVSVDSLQAYQTESEKTKREVQIPQSVKQDLDTLVSFDGKEYVSAPHGAKITGYHQDYVAQLARSGKILSKQVGNRWYVEKNTLIEHKKEKDSLLAAVQSQSVGISKSGRSVSEGENSVGIDHGEPYYNYTSGSSSREMPLMPPLQGGDPTDLVREEVPTPIATTIPIRVSQSTPIRTVAKDMDINTYESHNIYRKSKKNSFPSVAVIGTGLLVLATIVLVVAVGNPTGKLSGMLTRRDSGFSKALPASVGSGFGTTITAAFASVGDILESVIAPEISYTRRN